jgi:toxin ParE1/3/4
MGQYNRIADAIERLDIFPERVKLIKTDEERTLGLRQMLVDSFSVFFHIREERVIVTSVLYSASDIAKRLRDS